MVIMKHCYTIRGLVMFSEVKFISKDWGWEKIITNDEKYCGKILFIKKDSCISLQHHKLKDETFYLLSGKLKSKFINLEDLSDPKDIPVVLMNPGDVKHVPIGLVHQLFALEDSTIIEISTQHFDDDTYRISKLFE